MSRRLPRVRPLTDAEFWQIAYRHRWLAGQRARAHAGRGIPVADLISEALIGLFRAAELFEPRRGADFRAYAVHRIDERIRQAIADRPNPMRIPIDAQRLGRALRRGEAASLTPRERATAEAVIQLQATTVTTDQTREGCLLLRDLTEDRREGHGAPDRDDGTSALPPPVASALASLTPAGRSAIELRWGLVGDRQERSFAEIGGVLGIDAGTARQVYASAMGHLKAGIGRRAVPAG